MPFKLGPLEILLLLIISAIIAIVVIVSRKATQKPQVNPSVQGLLESGVNTPLSVTVFLDRAYSYLGSHNYNIKSNADTSVTFQDGRDADGCLFVVLLLLIWPVALIYWFASKPRQVFITWDDKETYLKVTARGNCPQAQYVAAYFLGSLPVTGAPIAEAQPMQSTTAKVAPASIYCHKCGSKLNNEADFCSKCGTKLVKAWNQT